MAFFDPPHKKIIAKSPAYFQRAAAIFGAGIEAVIATDTRFNASRATAFRTTVIGRLALHTAAEDPDNWAPEAVRYIETFVVHAARYLPEPLLNSAHNMVAQIVAGETETDSN